MTTYFAYGSNMDPRQMACRCPGATVAGIGVLRGFRFMIFRAGYASIIPAPEFIVHGILWNLTEEHEQTLDRYEEVARRIYTKECEPVELAGQTIKPLVYIGTDPDFGPPRPGYLEKVIFGAEHYGLPPDYVDELRTWHRFGRP